MVTMLALPVWNVWGPKAVLRVLTPRPAPVVSTLIALSPDSGAILAPARPSFWTVEKMLVAVWLIGVAVLLSRLLTGTIRTHRLRRRAGEGLVTPVTVGWLRPSIILPAGASAWPAEQLRAVMAHEEEHARRRDPLVQWMALLNRAVFWFHPLAWWVERRLAGLSEEACDDAVLMGGHDPFAYSEFLLGLARTVREAGARVEVVGRAMPGTFLPERIRRIAGGVKVQRISGKRMAGLVVFCGAAAMVCAGASVGYRVVAPAPVVTMEAPVVQESMTTVVVKQRKVRPPVLVAQAVTPGTSVHGSVFDPANLPVVGGSVTLANADAGASLTTTTDDQGGYSFAGFPAGTYSIAVRVPGFKMLTQTGIQVMDGANLNAGKMMLQLGSVTESVSIQGSRNSPAPFIGTLGPMTTIPNAAPPMPAPPVISGALPTTGGKVSAASLIKAVKPSYPAQLRQAGVAGTVKLQAVISKEGTIASLHVMESPDPGLTQAAVDAASQWRYRPTLLDGQPVEVLTQIDMNFSLTD
jgi:TonB family protein